MKESIFASMGSIQLKDILNLLFYYTYMYSKFGGQSNGTYDFKRRYTIYRKSLSNSMGFIQLKFWSNIYFYYTYIYTKFGDNRTEITIFIMFIKYWRKVFPLLWEPYLIGLLTKGLPERKIMVFNKMCHKN